MFGKIYAIYKYQRYHIGNEGDIALTFLGGYALDSFFFIGVGLTVAFFGPRIIVFLGGLANTKIKGASLGESRIIRLDIMRVRGLFGCFWQCI